ncbi:MAG: NAD(P)/FAD-dependent oxidoreductase [Bacteroidetes bacterium]|nr:NAD(P)/FAD-dependent oxidoreductase [Bacteroidota bacterium]
MTRESNVDVIIIGGSYAGLSAAMALGRSLRTVLVLDSGQPCNRQTPHSHNFLTQDGVQPAVIAAQARQQVAGYLTVQLRNDTVIAAEERPDGFEVTTQTGQRFQGHKLILATGIQDRLPDIPGFAACWGISVIHCPYCHGYEARGKRTAIWANEEHTRHMLPLVYNLTQQLTVLAHGAPNFLAEQRASLHAHNIQILETDVAALEHDNGQLTGIVFKDGRRESFEVIYAGVPFSQFDIVASLGCALTEQGRIQVDAFQRTSVEGVFACGDNSSPLRAVAQAVSSGNFAGAVVNMELATRHFWQ